ncbi:MAG: hypothetical protein K2W93_12090, partial [Burkholderiaceae bacterium]|nr:hypothetical protein [Burkholderiaceae bacterium]
MASKPIGAIAMHRQLVLVTALVTALHALNAQADNTPAGHTYTPPDAFTVSQTGPQLRLTAPEGDASIVMVEL